MRATDQDLLQRLKKAGDHDAFAVVVTRYADMVYGTCHRILGNDAKAADVTQETFFQLFKKADCINDCLGGWLHRVATHRCLDLIRQEATRRRREEAYVMQSQANGNSWSHVEPLVDEALDKLPEDLRRVLLSYYLEQKTTVRIAADMSTSQPTISRRLAQGLEQLRTHLRESGVAIGVVPLQAILVHGAELAPQSLLCKLGKMALTYAASAKPAATASAAAAGITAAKLAVAGIAVATVVLLVREPSSAPPPLPVASPALAVQSVPEPSGPGAIAPEKNPAESTALASSSATPPRQNTTVLTKVVPKLPNKTPAAIERTATPKDPVSDSPWKIDEQPNTLPLTPTVPLSAPYGLSTPLAGSVIFANSVDGRLPPRRVFDNNIPPSQASERAFPPGRDLNYILSTNAPRQNLVRFVPPPVRFQPSAGFVRSAAAPPDARTGGRAGRR